MTIAALTATRPWLLPCWTMLHYFWVGGLIGLAATALRRAVRGARPELCYGAAMLGLVALAVAPATGRDGPTYCSASRRPKQGPGRGTPRGGEGSRIVREHGRGKALRLRRRGRSICLGHRL